MRKNNGLLTLSGDVAGWVFEAELKKSSPIKIPGLVFEKISPKHFHYKASNRSKSDNSYIAIAPVAKLVNYKQKQHE